MTRNSKQDEWERLEILFKELTPLWIIYRSLDKKQRRLFKRSAVYSRLRSLLRDAQDLYKEIEEINAKFEK